jgi:hypothetical protein
VLVPSVGSGSLTFGCSVGWMSSDGGGSVDELVSSSCPQVTSKWEERRRTKSRTLMVDRGNEGLEQMKRWEKG